MVKARQLSEKEKERMIKKGSKKLEGFFDELFPGWREDPNMDRTPERFTKAFVNDITKSLYNSEDFKITSFENLDKYEGIVLQSNISVKSLCSHHLQNIDGIAHVAYIPSKDGKIVGLSKLNRIVHHFARMPQVQENLTQQIHDYVNKVCENNQGVAVLIQAKHNCVSHRGVRDDSDMTTATLSGAFKDESTKKELYTMIEMQTRNKK